MFIAIIVILASFFGYNYISGMNQPTTIKVSGAWALYPMMVKWAEEYQKIHPNVRIEVSAGGAGKGMTDALSGLVEIGMISREIYPEEVQQGAAFVKVTKDAVVATINANNPALNDILTKGMTRQGFYNIYIAANVTTWGEVVNRSDIKEEIHTYTRSDSCGAADTWAKYFGKKQENLNGTGVYGDPGILEAVRQDSLGIGYNNIGYAFDNETRRQVNGIRIIPIDTNENGKIDPEEEFYGTKNEVVQAILMKIYPSPPARDLYLVTKGNFTGPTLEFVKWILTDGQKYIDAAGYVALPPDTIAEQLNKLKG